ncbi:MAG: tyrosine-type recombinase/integrase [Anaerolineaceae bacterium]
MKKHRRGKNEGSISQRSSGSWRGQVSQSGKRISQDFHTRTDALVWIKTIKIKIDQGLSIRGSSTTLSEYLSSWLEGRRMSLRATTFHQYASLISHHILPSMGKYKLFQLDLRTIEDYYAQLLQRGVGVRTVRIVNIILSSSLDKAVKYGLIAHNPALGANLPVYRHGEMKIFNPAQVQQFLQVAENSHYYALYYTAITTGMRLGELLGLKWADIDWATNTIHVQRQRQYVPGQGVCLVEPKTRAGKRMIQLGQRLILVLRNHLKIQKDVQKEAVGKWVDLDLVFPSSIGTLGDVSNIRVDFNQILATANLSKIRIHDLRHTAASLLLNNHIPVIVVTQILGHSKPSITLDIYSHVFCDIQSEAAQVMDSLFQ